MTRSTPCEVREHGVAGPRVVVLHGGPGAPGSARSLCDALAGSFRVLEPMQRGSGGEPLTVARHVEDLHALMSRYADDGPAVVGHSWGAMLALAYAAAHPSPAAPLALIGCGTFDEASRAALRARVEARVTPALRDALAAAERDVADPDERLARVGERLAAAYSCDLLDAPSSDRCDARAYEETWRDMLRLQREGYYPAAFTAIRGPVCMLHGADDPHPGAMIRDGLARFVPQLEYREWAACGHYPWLERAVAREVMAALRAWLMQATERA